VHKLQRLSRYLLFIAGISAVLASLVASAAPLYAEQAKDAQSFVDSIGVNTHINYFDRLYGNVDLLKQRMEESGIRHVRDGAVLQNDAYNRTVYGRWRDLAAFGVKFDMCFDPRGSIKTPTPEQIAKLLDLAGGSVESIEGPNEYDVSKKPEWIDAVRNYQQALFQAGQQVPAAARLEFVGPSMAFAKNAQRVGDISAFVTHGNLHTYASGGPPDDLYAKQAQQVAAMYGQKPLIVTETGYHNAMNNKGSQYPAPEAVSAKYIPRLFFDSFNAGIERTYLYEFFDGWNDADQTNQEAHFGLVRFDGTPKPAFIALRNLISILRDSPGGPKENGALAYQLSGDTPSLAHTLLRKKNGTFYLALWQEVSSYDAKAKTDIPVQPESVTVSFQKPVRQARLYDPAKGTAPVQNLGKGSTIHIPVTDSVILLEITQ
jgi:hypothetical protein